MRLVITNNKKVESHFKGKVDTILLDSSGVDVLQKGLKVAEEGGRLLHDPSRKNGFYKSLVFLKGDDCSPDEKSIGMLSKCVEQAVKQLGPSAEFKEPIFSGILQKQDLDSIKLILS